MINDQALLHLIGRLEHENVQLREQLRQALDQNRELKADADETKEPDEPA